MDQNLVFHTHKFHRLLGSIEKHNSTTTNSGIYSVTHFLFQDQDSKQREIFLILGNSSLESEDLDLIFQVLEYNPKTNSSVQAASVHLLCSGSSINEVKVASTHYDREKDLLEFFLYNPLGLYKYCFRVSEGFKFIEEELRMKNFS